MKTLVVIAILLLQCLVGSDSFCQLPFVDGKLEYVVIDSTTSKTQNSLYKSAKLAIVETFVDAKEVIQYEDMEGGDIIGKGLLYFYSDGVLNTRVRNTAKFSIVINCRPNRFRIKLYDITTFTGTDEISMPVYGTLQRNVPKKSYQRYVDSFDSSMKGAIRSLQSKINKNNVSDF